MQLRMIDELLLSVYYEVHTPQPEVDDRTVLRHPVEEEMMRCIASGIPMEDFIAEWVSVYPTSSSVMLRRRWYKVARLASLYRQYASPVLDIVDE